MFDLKSELKNLPSSPGVYIMHNKKDEVIYVGKAKVLKNRVRQYFQNIQNHTPKVRAMVSNVAYFEYIITDSESEALYLECNLIKKYRPKYNILLKDDKHYPYLKITLNEDSPKILKTRVLKDDGAKYFGPYRSVDTIKTTLEVIQKIFKPPLCNKVFPRDYQKTRPCLNYHIKNCIAPCVNKMSKEEYHEYFLKIAEFLEGDHKKLLAQLTEEMKKASANMEYEKAGELRDRIRAISEISQKQKIINSDSQNDMDIIAVSTYKDDAFCEVFFVRGGKVLGRENYPMHQVAEDSDSEILANFIKQLYVTKTDIPPSILTETEPSDIEAISSWLSEKRGKKAEISVPKRGEKKKLLGLVKKNAELALGNYKLLKMQEKRQERVVVELSDALGLSFVPKRIEAYDISNISGSDNVSAMVVFEDGKPKKNKYRKFKIKWIEGADDYASMQETLYRRFLRAKDEEEKIQKGELSIEKASFLPYPDLILIDGGIGHLNSALEILEQMDLKIATFGMVKNDKHKTRGLVSQNGEIELSPKSPVFDLVTRIQDEVHNTAITYHRKLRDERLKKSELDEISGIGEARKQALLLHFGSVEKIKTKSIDELLKVKGMTQKSAKAVWEHFNQGD